MSQIQKGFTYTAGSPNNQVTYTNLNQLADSAILLPGAITDQTSKTTPASTDSVLIYSAADAALRKATVASLATSYTFNVKTYGAVGDGSTNDSIAFTNAINAAITTNGCVVIPTGDYNIASDLTFTFQGKITIRGEGMNNSRIIYSGTNYAMNFVMTSGTVPEFSSVNLHDFAVIQDNSTNTNANTAIKIEYPTGTIFAETHPGCSVENIWIGAKLSETTSYGQSHANCGFGYGLKLFNVCQSKISNVYLYGNFTTCNANSTPGDGSAGAGTGKGLWIRNCINNFYKNINVRFFSQGIYLDATTASGSEGNFFNQVNILTCPEAFRTEGLTDSWTLENFQIDNGNDFTTANKLNIRGIVINSNFSGGGYGGRISNGTCEVATTFGGPALLLNGTTGIQVSNSRFFTSNTSASVPYGVKVTGGTTDCQFTGVYAQGAGSYYGMYLDGGSVRNVITNLNTYGGGGLFDATVNTSNINDYYKTKGTGAIVNLSGGVQSIPNSTETDVLWNFGKLDDIGFWNSSTPRWLTIPYDIGIKRVSLAACINWAASATGYRQIKIKSMFGDNFAGAAIPGDAGLPSNYDSCATGVIDLTTLANFWVSGTSYIVGSFVKCPLNSKYYTSRTAFTSTVYPSTDSTNWTLTPMQFVVTATQDSGGALNINAVTSSNFSIKVEG
jgi:hypothetical protein